MVKETVKSFPVDDLVKALTQEDGSREKAQMIGGFMGEANDATGKIRFYLDPSLTTWLDLSPQYILHSLKLKTTQSPIGGTLIWLSHKVPRSERVIEPTGQFLP